MTFLILFRFIQVPADTLFIMKNNIGVIDLGHNIIFWNTISNKMDENNDNDNDEKENGNDGNINSFIESLLSTSHTTVVRMRGFSPEFRRIFSRLNPSHQDSKEVLQYTSYKISSLKNNNNNDNDSDHYYPRTNSKTFHQFLELYFNKFNRNDIL